MELFNIVSVVYVFLCYAIALFLVYDARKDLIMGDIGFIIFTLLVFLFAPITVPIIITSYNR